MLEMWWKRRGWTRRHGGAEATAELAADAVDNTIGGTAGAVGGDTLGIGDDGSAADSNNRQRYHCPAGGDTLRIVDSEYGSAASIAEQSTCLQNSRWPG